MTQHHYNLWMHRISRFGGHESSMLAIAEELRKRDWQPHVYAYESSDWTAPPPAWTQPGAKPPSQLAENEFYYQWSKTAARPLPKQALHVAMGAAAPLGQIRVIQFVVNDYYDRVKRGLAELPNANSPLRQAYQTAYHLRETQRERACLRGSKHLIAISEQVADAIARFDLAGQAKVHIIHHGTGLTPFTRKVTLEKAPLRILFVGALERKGIAKALRIVSRLETRLWHLTVIGPGDIAKWQAEAQNLGISDQVDFLGRQPAQDHYADHDVFLFPSTYDPFALVISEAASAGLLPMASQECGALELWNKRPDWMHLSATDKDEPWVRALTKVFEDRQSAWQLAHDAHKTFTQHSWSVVGQKYSDVFQQAWDELHH